MTEEEVALVAGLRFPAKNAPSFKFASAEKREIVSLLAASAKGMAKDAVAAEMLKNRSLWKKLDRQLHVVGDEKKKYAKIEGVGKVAEALRAVESGEKVDRHSSRMEEAVKAGDLDAMLSEGVKAPGDFARRFDKILRVASKLGRADAASKAEAMAWMSDLVNGGVESAYELTSSGERLLAIQEAVVLGFDGMRAWMEEEADRNVRKTLARGDAVVWLNPEDGEFDHLRGTVTGFDLRDGEWFVKARADDGTETDVPWRLVTETVHADGSPGWSEEEDGPTTDGPYDPSADDGWDD